MSFAHTCTSLYTSVTQDSLLWKRHCIRDFVCDALPAEGAKTWYQQWLYLCKEFGRYRAYYAQVKSAWNEIEAVLRQRCPQAWSELMASGAASEAELDDLERRLRMKLPDDYRCSLRIHGKLSVPLGTVSFLKECYTRGSIVIGVNHETFSLLGMHDTAVVTVRWSDLCVGYVVLAEVILNTPTSGLERELTVSYLFAVSSDRGAVCVDCPLGHVFTAFSKPRKHWFGRGFPQCHVDKNLSLNGFECQGLLLMQTGCLPRQTG